MISLSTILTIIVLHWFADFVCQTDWQAQNKSKNTFALADHVINYTLVWLPFVVGYLLFTKITYNILDSTIIWFLPITFAAHFITDYFTSRLNSKLWSAKKVHMFFVSVGFDQVL